MSKTQLQGAEPPMYLQRPSSARSQDVAHILAHTFRELFTRDSIGQDTVQYLNKSRGGNDVYHEMYVDALRKVQEERERRISEVSMLERHIMQAQARAMSADERALNRVSSAASNFPDLGLPPPRSSFRSCIDSELLRNYDLVTPDDFATEEPPIVPAPQLPSIPAYARETVTSSKKKQIDLDASGDIGSPPSSHRSLSSLSSGDDESHAIASLPKNSAAPGTRSQPWTNALSTEEREINRISLGNLQSKVDYLKNPRHVPPKGAGEDTLIKHKKRTPKQIGIKAKQDKEEPQEPPVIFVPSPPVIRFVEYTVGQVFEITLELKNVTKAMRPVRVVPPRTGYFAVGLGLFPGEHGLVAPGMSCHYTIRFSPDSMADYDDYLTVQTQSGSPMLIPLQGRRPPPVLTLPENLNVGQCLVGGCKITRLIVVNEGGPGRFCVMKRDQWPASNFKRTVSSTSVSLPPFEVRPAVFEMGTNSKTIIEVIFSPSSKEEFTQNLTVVCDNCHVKHFTVTGEGQAAGVELVSVEGGLSAAVPGELCDVTAQHMIRFEPLNPYTYYQRTVQIQNLANVDVPFTWVAVKPLLEPPDPEVEAGPRVGPQERVQDVESAFSVEPQTGTLPANNIAEFVVTFAPPKIQKFHSVLHLILRDVPSPPQPPPIERPASATSDGVAEIALPMNGNPGQTQDLTALELEFKAECEPFSVMLQPYAIYIPGQNLVDTSVKKQFRMVNTSVSSVLFQWDKVHGIDYIMEVEPPLGELGPQEELEFDLSVSGSKPGTIKHTMECHVQHLENPLTLFVQAEIKGPEVQIENPDLNFGLVRLGEKAKQNIRIRNMCQVSAQWIIEESPAHSFRCLDETPEFVFIPPGGELRPLEVQDITVVFMPRAKKSLRTVFDLHVYNGNYSSSETVTKHALMVRGEVQIPQACLLNATLNMPDVYLEVPTLHEVNLLNQTLLSTTYEWGQLDGADAEMCSVVVEPHTALLGPRENVQLAVHFTAHKRGAISDLRIPCFVAGMEEPLFLELKCDVHGLQVTYRTQNVDGNLCTEESEELLLDFGKTSIVEAPRRLLYIKNNSAITAPFSLYVDNFFSKPPTPPCGRPNMQTLTKSGQRRALLGRTPNLADPKSRTQDKAHAELSRAVLRPGKGAAFMLEPSNGVLGPFGEQVVEITGYSDMWGEYLDTLNCRVENLDIVKIPVRMGVTGCPLQFQMVAAQPSQKPILRFGTHISGVGSVVRQMRINNLSPFDIRLDWQIFNDDATSEKVVDLVTTYGKPFPLLDANGEDIVPEEEEVLSESDYSDEEEVAAIVSRPRLPIDYIPNSPETTPAVSREATQQSSERLDEDEEKDESPVASSRASPVPRPKVVTLTLREHLGMNINMPYDIKPAQLVIPAKGNTCINVSFTPKSEGETNLGQDCNGFALGYMSLIDEVASVENQVDRCQGYDATPLRLDMTAHVKPALLTIECTEEDGMQYRSAASDLLRNEQIMSDHLRLCGARLSNLTETPLVYQLITNEPFQIIKVDPRTGKPVAQLLETDNHTLHPRHNMMVQVGFRLCSELLHLAELLTAGEDAQREDVKLETRKHERRLHFKQDLIIQFSNNTIQRLPLSAILTIPALVLSKTELDFGICLVGQRREMQLELSNPTGSGSKWEVSIESSSDECTESTFALTPSSGLLEPYITYVSKNKVLIKVFFEAKHAEKYNTVFLFHGLLGETPVRLEIWGEGSYDERHEALVNV